MGSGSKARHSAGPFGLMQAIHIILLVPLVMCLAILAVYGMKLMGTSHPSKTWRTVGNFALFFAFVYAALAAFMLQQIKDYMPG